MLAPILDEAPFPRPLHPQAPMYKVPELSADTAYRGPIARRRQIAARLRTIPSFRLRELAAIALVALGFDTWAWRGQLGGYGAAACGLIVTVAILVGAPSRTSWKRALPFALLIGVASARLAFSPGLLSFVLLPASLLAFAIARRGGPLRVSAVAEVAVSALPALRSRIPAVTRGLKRVFGFARISEKRSLLPALIPAGLALVFAGVFALANPVVAALFTRAYTFVTNLVALPHPLRIALFVTAAFGASTLIRPALVRTPRRLRDMELPRDGEATTTEVLTARNSLVLLNILFLAYNTLDAVYLWAGSPPPGVTTQTYAHEGAAWLTVALALVTVVLGVFFRGTLAFDPRAQLSRRLSAVWIAQSGILTIGTFLRLAMHVRTSGLSDLRFVGALGTATVAVGLVLCGLKIRRHLRFRWLVEAQLCAFAGALSLYAVVPAHALSAMGNVPRIEAGDYGPLVHLRAEAAEPESAAMLLPLLHHPDIRVRQGVAALLSSEQHSLARSFGDVKKSSYANSRAAEKLDAEVGEMRAVLGPVCPRAAEATLTALVEVTVEGQTPPSLDVLPGASPNSNCVERDSY